MKAGGIQGKEGRGREREEKAEEARGRKVERRVVKGMREGEEVEGREVWQEGSGVMS